MRARVVYLEDKQTTNNKNSNNISPQTSSTPLLTIVVVEYTSQFSYFNETLLTMLQTE
jgi:hypothetical protein